MVEPIAKFTSELAGKAGVGKVHNIGLEEWGLDQESGSDDVSSNLMYDLFWNQWCVGHLNDDQLVKYLERCKARLSDAEALIVIKENITTSGKDVFDEVDSSVTR